MLTWVFVVVACFFISYGVSHMLWSQDSRFRAWCAEIMDRQSLPSAQVEGRVIALADALHGVNRVNLNLTELAKAKFTAEDIMLIRQELEDDVSLISDALEAFTSGRALSIIDEGVGPLAKLTPEGVCLWIRACLIYDRNKRALSSSYYYQDLRASLRHHERFLRSGDLVFTAWAYAAGMSADETAIRFKLGDGSVGADMRTLAALFDRDISVPSPSRGHTEKPA